MRDCSGEWFRLEPLRRMIARTISKASSDWTNNWPIKTYQISDRKQANNQKPSTNQVTEVKQFIREWLDCNKANNLSESGWIAIDLTQEQLTKYKNKYKHRQRSRTGVSSGSGAKSLEPARVLEPTAKPDV